MRNCDCPIVVCLYHVIPKTSICKPTPSPLPPTSRIVIIHLPRESHHKLNIVRLLTKSLLHVTTHLSPANSSTSTSPTNPLPPRSSSSRHPRRTCRYPLRAQTDTTHAFTTSEGMLEGIGAIRACLDVNESVSGGSIYDDELVLRKEPFKGCISTLGAVARCLRVIEDEGEEIERVLREMVRLQAAC